MPIIQHHANMGRESPRRLTSSHKPLASSLSAGEPWKKNSPTEPRRFRSESSNSETLFDYAGMKDRVKAIEEKMAGPTFWNNQEQAQATVAELKEIRALEKPLDEA